MPVSILITWFPVVVALLCIGFVALARREVSDYHTRRMMGAAIWYFTVVAVMFAAWMCYLWWPPAYVSAFPLYYFCLSFVTVALYRVVCEITLMRFRWAHYFLPVAMTLVVLVWSSMVPFEVKLGIVQGRGRPDADYPMYSAVFASVLITKFVCNLIYTALSVRRYLSYRKETRGTDITPYLLHWLRYVLILSAVSVLVPLATLVIGKNNTGIVMLTCSIAIMSVICFMMAVNILKGNYPQRARRRIVISTTTTEVDKPRPRRTKIRPESKIDKEELAAFKSQVNVYFNSEKPYLDPKLKLEVLAARMGYTRNRFSALVNQAYRMNFNAFINAWRLKELAAINKAPETKRLTRAQQVALAGFGSYDSYQRVEQEAQAAKAKRQRKPKATPDTNPLKENDNE